MLKNVHFSLVEIVDKLSVLLEDKMPFHFQGGPELAPGHGEVLAEDAPLLDLLRIGDRQLVDIVHALLDGLHDSLIRSVKNVIDRLKYSS